MKFYGSESNIGSLLYDRYTNFFRWPFLCLANDSIVIAIVHTHSITNHLIQ
jgi:hypothetical protein